MKRNVIVTFLVALLGLSFSFMPVQGVKAASVTSGYFVDVSARSAELYSSTGRDLKKSEPMNSKWYLGRSIDLKGTDYYQIATNEYLSSSDSYLYRNSREVIKVSSDGNIPVYDHNFVESSKVALAPGTSWYSDQVISTPEGMPFVRVAPNEYVGMWYVVQQSFTEKY